MKTLFKKLYDFITKHWFLFMAIAMISSIILLYELL